MNVESTGSIEFEENCCEKLTVFETAIACVRDQMLPGHQKDTGKREDIYIDPDSCFSNLSHPLTPEFDESSAPFRKNSPLRMTFASPFYSTF